MKCELNAARFAKLDSQVQCKSGIDLYGQILVTFKCNKNLLLKSVD